MAKTIKKYSKGMRRNVALAPPRAPRAKANSATAEPAPPPKELLPVAAGAAGAAVLGALLAREGWAPKRIAGGIGIGGAILAWKAGKKAERDLGLGIASASLAQLVLLEWGDSLEKSDGKDTKSDGKDTTSNDNKPRQARALPPGALESAFERARRRVALDADEAARYRRR